MRLDLREEETGNYISLFQNYLEDIQNANKELYDVLNDILVLTKYEKIQQTISNMIDQYHELIVDNVSNNTYQQWIESNASLRSCLHTYEAGEDAEEICNQIQFELLELISETLKVEKEDFVITDRPEVSDEGIEQIKDAIEKALNQIADVKVTYFIKINDKSDENDIYGTLLPLVNQICTRIEAFLEAAKEEIYKLHEFVIEQSNKLRDILENQGIINPDHAVNAPDTNIDANIMAANGEGTNSAKSKSVRNKLIAFAHNLNKQSNRKLIGEFKKLTAYLYNLAYWEMFSKEKSLSNDMLGQIMNIYNHFYTEYGGHLRDGFSDPDKREAHIKEEYIGVTRDRGNEKYFEGEEKWVFYSHAHNTYQVFNTIANMMKNIIEGCKTGEADDNNLIYGLYVLFEPIKTGYILKGYENEYATFSRWAAEEILTILGEDISQLNNSDVILHEKYEEVDEIDVNDENFSEENMEKAILLIERIVEEIGVDTLNQSVEKNYDIMKEIYAIYGKKSGPESKTQSKTESKDEGNLYGRYTVNDQSIQLMEGLCVETNSILEPLDQYYKDKFDKLDKNFDKTHKTIHTISSFLSLWGLGSWNLSKAPTDVIWDQIHLGSLPIALCPQMGLLITGGAHLVKIFDVIMPFTKKNKTLVKLNKKIWDLTREDIQAPYYNRAMDQYMMEHYEFKYRGKQDKAQFSYFHSVTEKIEEKSQRRAFENACFAAEGRLTNLNYTIVGDFNENEMREIDCGIFLNLLRSGMSSKQNILAEDANKITDQLYDIYATRESITPKVALNPVSRMISGNIS